MVPYHTGQSAEIHHGDCLEVLRGMDSESVNCCVTSPPYWGLRDYGEDGQLGLESTPEEYVSKMVGVFREVRRVLRDDGTLWLNLGDSYASGGVNRQGKGSNSLDAGRFDFDCRVESHGISRGLAPGFKPKDLVGIPWRVAFALQADGWYLRQDIIWSKPNPMPESVTDRCTKAHEYIFLMSKNAKYFYDYEAVKEAGTERPRKKEGAGGSAVECKKRGYDNYMGTTGTRNRRSVWTVTTAPFKDAHFAVFPPKLIEPCILAGCPKGGTVLDPFMGSGTTLYVAKERGRKGVGIELNEQYIEIAMKRLKQEVLAL